MSNDLLDEHHARAALDILEADQGINLYIGVVPSDATLPYVLAYTNVTWPAEGEGMSFEGVTSACVTRWWFHCAAETETTARAVAGRVRGLLRNVQPTIASRSCGRIQQEASLPPVPDETTGKPVFDIAAIYILTTFAG